MLMRAILGKNLLHLPHRRREFALPIENVAEREVGFEKHVGVAALARMMEATFRQFSTCLKLAAEQVERRLTKKNPEQLRRVPRLDAKFACAVEGVLHPRRS